MTKAMTKREFDPNGRKKSRTLGRHPVDWNAPVEGSCSLCGRPIEDPMKSIERRKQLFHRECPRGDRR